MIEWFLIKKVVPEAGQSYLIRVEGPGRVADVAFYEGRRPNGDHWWVLGNIELNDDLITHWAVINYPDEEDEPMELELHRVREVLAVVNGVTNRLEDGVHTDRLRDCDVVAAINPTTETVRFAPPRER